MYMYKQGKMSTKHGSGRQEEHLGSLQQWIQEKAEWAFLWWSGEHVTKLERCMQILIYHSDPMTLVK